MKGLRLTEEQSRAVWAGLAALVVGAFYKLGADSRKFRRRQRQPPDERVDAVGKLAEVRSQARHSDLELVKKLAELKDQSILTQAEFEEKKAALLTRIK